MGILFQKQFASADCGPTAVYIIARYYGLDVTLSYIKRKVGLAKHGVSFLELSNLAESIGFHAIATKVPISSLEEVPLPIIVHWNKNHFVIIYKVRGSKIYIADPAIGKVVLSRKEFEWHISKTDFPDKVIALILTPTPNQKEKFTTGEFKRNNIKTYFNAIFSNKAVVFKILVCLFLSTMFSLLGPLITQNIVDVGIQTKDLNFITICLIGQIFLFVGETLVGLVKNWMTQYLTNKLSIQLFITFIVKLTKLPLSYFETVNVGDTLKRISDNNRIVNFITSTLINSFFSVFNLFVYGLILSFYSTQIFIIYLIASTLYTCWVFLFQEKRKQQDNLLFTLSSNESTIAINYFQNIQDIKLNGCENPKRWEWEQSQAKIMRVSYQSLTLSQIEATGGNIINQLKNIIITYLAATLVINGKLSFGMMLSMQYIIGSINSPLQSIVQLIKGYQSANNSTERLDEVNNQSDEEPEESNLAKHVTLNKDIVLSNVTFKYTGSNEEVLNNISFTIPQGKTTAIVGVSGSGKTTLVKLLLKYYDSYSGNISLGNLSLKSISHSYFREQCGIVMQESKLFEDTFLNNICLNGTVDWDMFSNAVEISNVKDFMNELPFGLDTKLGRDGISLSSGQKQRLLIARAVYRNPKIIFLDEATNSLDANNEKLITENLEQFLTGKTVVVIAHRLSTIKNADQIIVLNQGKVCEIGTHTALMNNKGKYYDLIYNQI